MTINRLDSVFYLCVKKKNIRNLLLDLKEEVKNFFCKKPGSKYITWIGMWLVLQLNYKPNLAYMGWYSLKYFS